MQVFEELDIDKRKRIINAGMEEFGIHGYKHANTEDIARKAGISKGLLFYYFKNKQSFYLYLFEYCETLLHRYINVEERKQVDDFYELIRFGAYKKMDLMKEHPYCMEFVLELWFSSQENGNDILSERIHKILSSTYTTWFKDLKLERFKEGYDPMLIFQMLTWMTQGYLSERKITRQPLNIDDMMKEFDTWEAMFKKMTYKEEYV